MVELARILKERQNECLDLYASYINPRLVKALGLIGFTRPYVKAEGPYLYDAAGNQYLDMLAGYGVFAAGRNHPKIKAVLKEYLELDYPSMVQLDTPLLASLLAEKLLSLAPGDLQHVFFTNSGAEGIEGAIKFARRATGRSKVVYSVKDFHGLTLGCLSVNGSEEFREGFGPLLPDTVAVEYGNAEALEKALADRKAAAFVLEPIQGKTVAVPPDGFLAEASRLCRRYGTILIADEVMTGFGRTGKWFACQWEEVDPDIVVVAKALSGGFVPVGAILFKRWIYNKVFSSLERCVIHSNTFGRGGMAMAAGLATIEVIEEEGLVENARIQGQKLLAGLRELQAGSKLIKDVRGKGLMIAVEMQPPKGLWGRLSGAIMGSLSPGLLAQAFVVPLFNDHRILTQIGGYGADVIRLLPPLIIGEREVERFLSAFQEVLEQAAKFPGPIWEIGSRLAKVALSGRETGEGR